MGRWTTMNTHRKRKSISLDHDSLRLSTGGVTRHNVSIPARASQEAATIDKNIYLPLPLERMKMHIWLIKRKILPRGTSYAKNCAVEIDWYNTRFVAKKFLKKIVLSGLINKIQDSSQERNFLREILSPRSMYIRFSFASVHNILLIYNSGSNIWGFWL